MRKLKKPFLFTLACLPVTVVAVLLVCLYQFELYPAELLQEAVAQLGSISMVLAVTVVQNTGLVLFCCFFGYLLANRTGLWKPVRPEKRKVCRTLLLSAVLGIVFSLDYWTFGVVIPEIRESVQVGLQPISIAASVLYGGVVEELLLRLFVMSLLVFLLGKLFCRKQAALPDWCYGAANWMAAILFAAGHLPATMTTFGALTPLLLVRCFLLNGGFGLAFGWLYRKYGLVYAMISHMTVHLVSKLLWFLLI